MSSPCSRRGVGTSSGLLIGLKTSPSKSLQVRIGTTTGLAAKVANPFALRYIRAERMHRLAEAVTAQRLRGRSHRVSGVVVADVSPYRCEKSLHRHW